MEAPRVSDMDSKRFFRSTLLVAAVISIVAALFNFFMDPYLVFGTPRTRGINDRKPAAESALFLMKAYDAVRTRPNTLILGASKVGLGINPESPVWPREMRPVYNLGVPN